jgi:hypothetical protein
MKYMLIMAQNEAETLDPAQDCGISGSEANDILTGWLNEMESRGVLGVGERLQPVATATTVQNRDGEVLVADGPFAETKEQMAGMHLIDVADLDEAIEVAAKHPCALIGTVEVRPVHIWE